MSLSLKKLWHAQALTLGLTVAVLYVLSVIVSTLFPDIVLPFVGLLLHGSDVSGVYQNDLTLSTFIVGLVMSFLTGYVIGAIHALIAHGIEESK